MRTASRIRLEMPSDPLYLSGAREMVRTVVRRLGFSDEACGQIALAVDEALCNVIRHGYGRRTDRPVWLSLSPIDRGDGTSRGVKIVIEDEAEPTDPEQIRGRPLDEVRPGGLGVHIIRQVMDEVRYERRGKVGMRLTMIKHRRPADASDAGETCCE